MNKSHIKKRGPLLRIFDSPENDELWRDKNGELLKKFRNDVEKALEACEAARNKQRGDGKNMRLIRTRRSIRDCGGVEALTRIVNRKNAARGFEYLKNANELKLSFEYIVAKKHSKLFDPDTVCASRKLLEKFGLNCWPSR